MAEAKLVIPLLAEAWRKRGGSIGVSSGVNNLVGVRSRKPRVSFRGRTFFLCWWAEGRGSCAKALAEAKVISCWWAEGRGSCAKALAEAKVKPTKVVQTHWRKDAEVVLKHRGSKTSVDGRKNIGGRKVAEATRKHAEAPRKGVLQCAKTLVGGRCGSSAEAPRKRWKVRGSGIIS